MMTRYDFKFTDATVELFEQYMYNKNPDWHWICDKVNTTDNACGWEYKHENTEIDFDTWLNVIYYMQHPYYKEISKNVVVENA